MTKLEPVQLFRKLYEEELTTEQQVAYLTQLAPDNLTPQEILQCAKISLEYAEIIPGISDLTVDLVGTGGDGLNTFNISTTAAFVAAGAGVKIAKSGLGCVNSLSSSYSLLQALDIDIQERFEGVQQQFENFGICFVMQPYFHPKALDFKAARKILAQKKQKSIFNLIGPLANPASVKRKALGVHSQELVDIYAEILSEMGAKKSMVFYGDGMDELSLAGPNHIAIIHHNKIEKMELSASDTCLPACKLSDLAGGDAIENAKIAEAILRREHMGAKRNVVILNAAAAVFLGYPESISLFDAINIAQESLDSGAAYNSLLALKKQN